jgi:CopG family transcriptional regulator/antitoxin EndoAI
MRETRLVTISLSPNLLKRAEKAAKEEQRTRSELLREALRKYLDDREWSKIYRYGERRARARGIDEEDVERLVDEMRK